MNQPTTIVIHPALTVAPVNRRTFGSFVEHVGRCVYTGIYEPDHPTADEDGFRGDVLALTRELGVSTVRYPGGNFVSGYRWEDGVGPVNLRPRRRDLAWHGLETNEVGIDEFARWADKAGVEIIYAVNLGTRGVLEALDVNEYLNHPQGTTLSDARTSNGAKEPYGVKMWCLGNEMDGPWQTGHKTAAEYGRLAAETARALRFAEPDLELVVCGSSSAQMPTFGAWEAEVLEHTYELVDYISCHAYYEEKDGDLGSFLASGVDMDHFVASVVATADSVGARLKTKKRINLAFDEWNVWYISRFESRPKPTEWEAAGKVIEEEYNVADAVVVGGLLISLLRNSDRVTVACQAQLVNAIAPIQTEPGGLAWRQSIFYPFALTSRLAVGDVLQVCLNGGESYLTARYGEVPMVDAVATYDWATDTLAMFLLNRSLDRVTDVCVDLATFPAGLAITEVWTICDEEVRAHNSADCPDRVAPKTTAAAVEIHAGVLKVALPAVSWTALQLRPA